MEEILIEHGRLTAAQAVVVVEIAKHRARLSDCGRSYGESRWLRSEFDRDRLRRVLACLCSVASADGDTSPSESGEIHQIALELGFSADDIEA